MSCLSQIYPKLCTDGGSTGGVRVIKVLDGQSFDQDARVVGQDGEITAIALTATATVGFEELDFYKENAQIVNTGTSENGNTNEELTITINIPKKDKLKYEFIRSAANCNCGLVIYYEDLNGIEWLVGTESEKERVFLTTYEADTGLAFADPNQYVLTFTCRGKRTERVWEGGALPEPTP